jgi:S1-C subfamily serine protease
MSTFQQACQTIREAVYGLKCTTPIGNNLANSTTGTGFMIASGVLATAAHVIHFESNLNGAVHQSFQAIRAPDIGQIMERAQLIAEDTARDIAFLRITNPRSTQSVVLEPNILSIGTICGSMGFPLSFLNPQGGFMLDLRFQGAFISSFNTQAQFYETDSLMYKGASGCPGFTVNGHVFGMHNRSINSGAIFKTTDASTKTTDASIETTEKATNETTTKSRSSPNSATKTN